MTWDWVQEFPELISLPLPHCHLILPIHHPLTILFCLSPFYLPYHPVLSASVGPWWSSSIWKDAGFPWAYSKHRPLWIFRVFLWASQACQPWWKNHATSWSPIGLGCKLFPYSRILTVYSFYQIMPPDHFSQISIFCRDLKIRRINVQCFLNKKPNKKYLLCSMLYFWHLSLEKPSEAVTIVSITEAERYRHICTVYNRNKIWLSLSWKLKAQFRPHKVKIDWFTPSDWSYLDQNPTDLTDLSYPGLEPAQIRHGSWSGLTQPEFSNKPGSEPQMILPWSKPGKGNAPLWGKARSCKSERGSCLYPEHQRL